MIYAHHITYLENDELSGRTGEALAASKQHVFNDLESDGNQVTELCMSMSADGA